MTQPDMLWPALEGQGVSTPVPLLGVSGCLLSSYIGKSCDFANLLMES